MYINGGFTVTEMDNNAYCAPQAGTNNLTYTQNLGFDANGIEVDSIYGNLDSLFTCLDDLVAAGAPLSYVNNDLYGGGRSTTAPTIGPIEYISPDAFSLGEAGLSICDGDTLILGSEISGASYLWTNGDTTGTIMVTSPGNYGVSVSTGCGNASDDIDVEDAASIADFIPDSSWMTITFTNTSQKAVTYMWDFGDGTNSTDMNPVHLYTATGMYNVCLTATGECDENTTCQMVRAWNGVGINENNGANNISIYPNPASNLLTIEADGVNGNVMSVEISNISGQIVMNSQLNDFNGYAKEQLDISELTKGVYFVKIYTNEVTTTKRLVVQK
jgi:hypothetical protein